MDEKALRNIIQRIQDDANRKIEEYRKIAEQKKKEILEKAREELEKELKEMKLRYEREIENTVNYIISQAKIGERRMVMEEKENGINAVFSEALRISDGDSRYRRYLEKSLKKAKESLGSGTIRCREKDAETIKAMLPPDFELKADLEDADAGIIALSRDGRKILDLRVSRVLEDMKYELRKEVSSILYGGA